MTEVQAPSIGSAELNYDPLGNRVRQIMKVEYQDPDWMQNVLEGVNSYALETGATRRSIRMLLSEHLADLDDELYQVLDKLSYKVEGRIELSDRFEGFGLTYISSNNPERVSLSPILDAELGLIRELRRRPRKNIEDIFAKVYERGFQIEQLQGDISSDDQERIELMYSQSFKSYPFNIRESIKGMIQNKHSDVFAARYRKNGQLYAICATEELRLDLPNKELVMKEMGDSARIHQLDDGVIADGLNAPLKLALIHRAAKSDTDMVFCESRAAWEPVNKINHDIGMIHSGFLHKHTVISGPDSFNESTQDTENARKYGNMNVWSVSRSQIDNISSAVSKVLR